MKYLKTYKIFESIEEYERIIRDILIELEDDGLLVKIGKKDDIIEINIQRPFGSPDREIPGVPQPPGGKYPGNLFFWYEIKNSIITLNDWFYEYSENETNSTFRMFSGGVEFGTGWYKPEDFKNFGDYISFTNLRIEMKF